MYDCNVINMSTRRHHGGVLEKAVPGLPLDFSHRGLILLPAVVSDAFPVRHDHGQGQVPFEPLRLLPMTAVVVPSSSDHIDHREHRFVTFGGLAAVLRRTQVT